MAAKVPRFPLWEVLTDPAVAQLSPSALGSLVSILGTLWAANDMRLPAPQTAVQAIARAHDAQWARNRQNVLAAFHALAPALSALRADLDSTHARKAASMLRALACKQSKRSGDNSISNNSTSNDLHPIAPAHPRRSADHTNGIGVRASGLAVVGGPALSRAENAARKAKPAGTTLRD